MLNGLDHLSCLAKMRLCSRKIPHHFSSQQVEAQTVTTQLIRVWHCCRLGRALTRLRTNRNLGLSHGCLVDVGLLLGTVLRPTKCSSCLGSWMLLAANLHFVLIAFSSSLLFQPISSTGSDAVIMQVCHRLGLVLLCCLLACVMQKHSKSQSS